MLREGEEYNGGSRAKELNVKGISMTILWVAVGLILVVAIAGGCAGLRKEGPPAAATADANYTGWPTQDWPTGDPASHGVDAGRLRAMTDYIKLKGLDIEAIVVIRDGVVVFEQYGPGQGPNTRAEVYSVTKSFASTLVGIARRKGLLQDLDAPILALLPDEYQNVDERKQAMTLDDVLTMRSGLKWDDNTSISPFYSSPDPVKYMLDLPMAAEPGTRFNYCTGCSHLLMALIEKETGMPALEFAKQELFDPLGIRNPGWVADRDGLPLGGWGLQLSAREMAKLGYLFLRGGTWDGKEIVTPEWVKAATARHTDSDSTIGTGYGYQWWTNAQHPAYMALGRFGQTVYVNPEKDLVVAIRAQLPNHDAVYYLIDKYIEPAVK
jgi:CubicO group peptidase (beta-lactamase class C family)